MKTTYTFVLGANIPAYAKVGDAFTWLQQRPSEGGYGNSRPTGAPKEITGRVIALREQGPITWVDVEAERVGRPEEDEPFCDACQQHEPCSCDNMEEDRHDA